MVLERDGVGQVKNMCKMKIQGQNRTIRICKNVINETAIQAANFISVYLLVVTDILLLTLKSLN